MNVLFVCLGNICRSPMAEGIMRQIFEDLEISGRVESAGTADWNVGRAADPRAIAVAGENGVDIGRHRARQVCADDFCRFDLIVAVDRQNETALRKMFAQEMQQKIKLLSDADISDPYSGDIKVFRRTFKQIEESCRELAKGC